MPKITFLPLNVTVEFESGRLPYEEHGRPESVLDVALNFGVPLEHACGGSCACTTCHVIVRQGDDNLSPMEECEEDRLDAAAGLTLHSRLGCQAVVQGDIVIEIPDWNRNYVSEGGGSINLGNAIPTPKRTGVLAIGDPGTAQKALEDSEQAVIVADAANGVVTVSLGAASGGEPPTYSLYWVPRDREGRLNVAGVITIGEYQELADALTEAKERYSLTGSEWKPADRDWLSRLASFST